MNGSSGNKTLRTGTILGYPRVSTAGQDFSGQQDRLIQQGTVRVFEDVSVYAGLRASMVANCSCAPLCMVPRSSLYLSISQP